VESGHSSAVRPARRGLRAGLIGAEVYVPTQPDSPLRLEIIDRGTDRAPAYVISPPVTCPKTGGRIDPAKPSCVRSDSTDRLASHRSPLSRFAICSGLQRPPMAPRFCRHLGFVRVRADDDKDTVGLVTARRRNLRPTGLLPSSAQPHPARLPQHDTPLVFHRGPHGALSCSDLTWGSGAAPDLAGQAAPNE